jgi:hypothetical protein
MKVIYEFFFNIVIISNNLLTHKLQIGQMITFDCINIKDVSERFYTKEETEKSIMIAKVNNNPITKFKLNAIIER